jgi:hypothetical protein
VGPRAGLDGCGVSRPPAGVVPLIESLHSCQKGRDSSVGISTGYGLESPESNPGRGEIFRTRPDRPGAHPASCKRGTWSFMG